MRKKIIFLFMAICLIVPAFGVSAAEQYGYVHDRADLLIPEEEEHFERMAIEFRDTYDMDFVVVTTDDAEGKSAMEYADDFYDLRYDTSAERGGVLYLIDMDNREIYVSTCGRAIRYLTDERIEEMLDAAYEKIEDGDYAGVFDAFFAETNTYMNMGIPSGQYNYDTETGERDYYREPKRITMFEFLLGIMAGAAAAIGTCGFIAGKYKLKFEDFHYDAYTDSEVRFDVKEDRLVNTFVTHRHIPRNTNSTGSGGGGSISSTHHSSGGVSHGGGGRHF